jgi:hypothetical protein
MPPTLSLRAPGAGRKAGPAGIEATSRPAATKVAPLAAKATLGGPTSISTAPRPGPATMQTWPIPERAALAT